MDLLELEVKPKLGDKVNVVRIDTRNLSTGIVHNIELGIYTILFSDGKLFTYIYNESKKRLEPKAY